MAGNIRPFISHANGGPSNNPQMLCPFNGFEICRGEHCALWVYHHYDGEVGHCGLANVNTDKK